jgi:hypothetical protein
MAIAEQHLAIEEMRQLRPFWRDGRIIRWPARESRRRLLLAEVIRAFPPGKRLAEPEVDAILREFWPDYCQLRRALVDREMLNRKDGIYWRVG